MVEEGQSEWSNLKEFPSYEINSISSEIRFIETKEVIDSFRRRDNYLLVKFKECNKPQYIHKLMAVQFLTPDGDKKVIDHIDRNRTNNSLSNLRYTTTSMNCLNRSSHRNVVYEYIDTLPEGATLLKPWDGIDLKYDYYKSGNDVYLYNSIAYRKLIKSNKGAVKLAIKTDTGKIKYKTFYPKNVN
jgi:hypothetical protein